VNRIGRAMNSQKSTRKHTKLYSCHILECCRHDSRRISQCIFEGSGYEIFSLLYGHVVAYWPYNPRIHSTLALFSEEIDPNVSTDFFLIAEDLFIHRKIVAEMLYMSWIIAFSMGFAHISPASSLLSVVFPSKPIRAIWRSKSWTHQSTHLKSS